MGFFKLCYVREDVAFFTTKDIVGEDRQGGDNWDEAYAWNDDGPPYSWDGTGEPYEVIRLKFDLGDDLKTSRHRVADCEYSVYEMNAHHVPWLADPGYTNSMSPVEIWAGCQPQQFIELIREAGGEVFFPVGDVSEAFCAAMDEYAGQGMAVPALEFASRKLMAKVGLYV